MNGIQKYMLEKTRLGIPVLTFNEALHGLMVPGATSFPQAIALGSTWDTTLVEQVFAVAALEGRSRGTRQVLSPVLDLARDPRWGRTNETFGEDPYLCGIMGVAYVKQMEAAGLSTMIKHFVANMGLDGQFTGPVHFTERLLRENYFPAFKACVDSGASSVM